VPADIVMSTSGSEFSWAATPDSFGVRCAALRLIIIGTRALHIAAVVQLRNDTDGRGLLPGSDYSQAHDLAADAHPEGEGRGRRAAVRHPFLTARSGDVAL